MFVIQLISTLIVLLFVTGSNGHPFPQKSRNRGSAGNIQEDSSYDDYSKDVYVDENGKVLEGGDDTGPPEGYEVVNSDVMEADSDESSQWDAPVNDGVNLNEFDQDGNYIGPVISNRVAGLNSDQDYYESDEEISSDSPIEQDENSGHNIDVSQRVATYKPGRVLAQSPEQEPYLDIEKKYPGILRQLKDDEIKEREQKFNRSHSQDIKYEDISDEPKKINNGSEVGHMTVQRLMELIRNGASPTLSDNLDVKDSNGQHLYVKSSFVGNDGLKIKQKASSRNSNAGANQEKYDATSFQPKSGTRILARYKVIIPVIMANHRFRVNRKQAKNTST